MDKYLQNLVKTATHLESNHMEILGSQTIPATQEQVWDALNNPDVLKKCLPGCESVEQTSPDLFKVKITTAIGPLKAKFSGTLQVTEAKPPESCVLIFEGQGGAVGFGKGSSSVTLKTVPDGTELSYSAKAHVGGKLAQIGSRLIDSVAKKMSDDFFKAFNQELGGTGIQPTLVDRQSQEESSENTLTKNLTESSSSTTGTMVPAWWLIVAAGVGAMVTLGVQVFLK